MTHVIPVKQRHGISWETGPAMVVHPCTSPFRDITAVTVRK